MGEKVQIPTRANIDRITLEHVEQVDLRRVYGTKFHSYIELRLVVAAPAENKDFWEAWLAHLRFVMVDAFTPCRYDAWFVNPQPDGSFIVQTALAVRLTSSDPRVPSSKENVNLLAGTCSREISFTRP